MDQLFDTAKICLFLDSITHTTEDRRGTETKVVKLGLRVDTLDPQLALSLDPSVRNTLFRLDTAAAHPHIKGCTFALGVPTQNLIIFAAPDMEKASIALLQAKITDISASVDKDSTHYKLTFKAAFGPASKDELLFVEEWRTNSKFVTFERVEPQFELDQPETEAVKASPDRALPGWDDGDQVESDEVREKGARRPKAKAKPNGAVATA